MSKLTTDQTSVCIQTLVTPDEAIDLFTYHLAQAMALFEAVPYEMDDVIKEKLTHRWGTGLGFKSAFDFFKSLEHEYDGSDNITE